MGTAVEMNVPASWDVVLKCVVVGDSGVGKTSLIARFAHDTFEEDAVTTIGVDFVVKTITFDAKRVKLVLWDTAGNERFRTLTGSYYRGAQLALFVYDVHNTRSFEHLMEWVEEANLYLENCDCVKLLVGNKVDQVGCVAVSRMTSVAFAQRHDMLRAETSAKSGFCVSSAFRNAIEKVLATPSLIATAPTANVVVLNRNGERITPNLTGCC